MKPGSSARFRLADLLAPLSCVTDLGMGEPEGQALRSTLLSVRLGERLGLNRQDLTDCYYTSMLRHIGCTATSYEESSQLAPDEIAGRTHLTNTDLARPREMLATARALLAQVPVRARPRLIAHLVNPALGREIERSLCEVAAMAARRLGLGEAVADGVYDVRERWDGKGHPRHLRGEAIALAARLAQACGQLASLSSVIGADAACSLLGSRAGGWFDPGVARPLSEHGAALLKEIDSLDLFEAVRDAEPGPGRIIDADQVDAVARTFADLTDLKQPWTHGHSSGVAALAERAAASLRLAEPHQIRHAALLHDIGRVGIPMSVWVKPGPLDALDWERVRLHPYHSERILNRCPAFAGVARIVGMHHERLDGSGYYRQAIGSAIPAGARLLAAADAFQAMTQERPHRPAWTVEGAAAHLRREKGLDPEMVSAVLAAAGAGTHQRVPIRPNGLSEREIEVLRLVAKGLSNRAIGAALGISPRTAEHHVQSIYTKAGFSTRAAAAIYAMEHHLL